MRSLPVCSFTGLHARAALAFVPSALLPPSPYGLRSLVLLDSGWVPGSTANRSSSLSSSTRHSHTCGLRFWFFARLPVSLCICRWLDAFHLRCLYRLVTWLLVLRLYHTPLPAIRAGGYTIHRTPPPGWFLGSWLWFAGSRDILHTFRRLPADHHAKKKLHVYVLVILVTQLLRSFYW